VTDYAKTTDFQAKDALPSGDANKVVKGTEFEAEFDNIVTAVASKADKASPTFTGVVVVPSPVTLGGTSMTATAAELNTLAGITATTADLNILDGVTATTAELNVLDGLDRGSILYGNASGATAVLGQGTANQVLTSDGTDIAWQNVAAVAALIYNAWTVKTTTYTAVNGDQIIANHASTPFTVTLPASPSVGDSVTLKNVGAALLTVGRNSQNINSAAANATMPTGNAAQLVYVDVTIGWKEL
tara:strand:- start:30 stop:761 length:732 start_codon:yes stop_codon:yes gene_type:complete